MNDLSVFCKLIVNVYCQMFSLLFLDHQVCPGSTQGSEEPPAERSAKETSHPQVQERYGGNIQTNPTLQTSLWRKNIMHFTVNGWPVCSVTQSL